MTVVGRCHSSAVSVRQDSSFAGTATVPAARDELENRVMKAWRVHQFGAPRAVLQLDDVEKDVGLPA